MGFWRIVITIILPPLGVLLGKGFGWAFIINILLTLLDVYSPVIDYAGRVTEDKVQGMGVECIDDWGGEEGGVYCRRPVWFGL